MSIRIGSKVRVNDTCPLEWLRGDTGVVVEGEPPEGYVLFATRYQGWPVEACHPESELDVLQEGGATK